MTLTQITEKSIKDGEIINADINASAAIAGTKIDPNFGSQDITTTGLVSITRTTNSETQPILEVKHGNGSQGIGLGYNTVFATGGNTNVDLKLASKGSGEIYCLNNLNANADLTIDTNTLHVDSSNNRVGIGTTSPAFKLHVDGTSRFGSTRINSTTESSDGAFNDLVIGDYSSNRGISILSGATGQGAIGFAKSGTTADGYLAYNHNGTATSSAMTLKSQGHIKFNAGSTTKVYIEHDGKLGIGTSTPAAKLHVIGGDLLLHDSSSATNSGQAVYFQSTTSGGATGSAHCAIHGLRGDNSTGIIRFDTRKDSSTTEKMRIDSDGKVGIGNTSPTNVFDGAGLKIEKYQQRSTSYASPDGYYGASLGEVTNSATKVWATVESHYAQANAVSAGLFLKAFHQDAGGSQAGFTIKNLKSGNDLTFSRVTTAASTGNPAVETERLRIRSDGGITFNGDTAAANALDDYEEGSWTPVPSFGDNLVGASYQIANCQYTKIGRQVTIKGNINFSSRGSSTGGFKITGIPFTDAYAGSYSHSVGAVIVFFGPNSTGSMNCFTSSGSQVRFRMHNESNDNQEPTHSDIDNDTKLMFSITYFTS